MMVVVNQLMLSELYKVKKNIFLIVSKLLLKTTGGERDEW